MLCFHNDILKFTWGTKGITSNNVSAASPCAGDFPATTNDKRPKRRDSSKKKTLGLTPVP